MKSKLPFLILIAIPFHLFADDGLPPHQSLLTRDSDDSNFLRVLFERL
jgi:hypothetical protein